MWGMAKKKKQEMALDEAQHHHQVAFHEGERHIVEKFCQWLKDQRRTSIAVEDMLQFLQEEMDPTRGEDRRMPPNHQSHPSFTHAMPLQQPVLSAHTMVSDIMGHDGLENVLSFSKGAAAAGDQSKTHALGGGPVVSPTRRCFSALAFIQNDSTASSQRRHSVSMADQQTQQGEKLDTYEQCNSSSQISHTGLNIYGRDARVFEQRPLYSRRG